MGVLDVTIGPILTGVIINVMLYGVMIMQTFEYYRNCVKDPAWLKWLVGTLFLADTVNTVFDCMNMYQLFVTNFGDFVAAQKPNWTGGSGPAMTALISAIVQLFFASRVLRLTGSKALAVVIVILTLAQTAGGLASAIIAGTLKSLSELTRLRNIGILWLGGAAINDILIAASLVAFLGKSKTGFIATDDVISKIIRTTIQTGLLTTIWATIDLILFLALNNNLHIMFNLPLCKLYSNSLMSSLNARSRWDISSRSQHSTPQTGAGSLHVGRPDHTKSGRVSVLVHQSVDVTHHAHPDIIELGSRHPVNEDIKVSSDYVPSTPDTHFKTETLNSTSADDIAVPNHGQDGGDRKVSWGSAV